LVLDLPRQSQHAQVTQRVGLTDITINYSRPLVKGRKIWGGLVPYGQVWRAGANENTTIKFSDPVTIEGQALPTGIYGLHMIPGGNEWTIIFSKNSTSWGSFSYKSEEDALRVKVKPQAASPRELLTYEFSEVSPNSTVVTLEWEKLVVPFKVGVNTNQVVEQSLQNQLRGLAQFTWDGWNDAATYLLDNKGSPDVALQYANKSIEVEERFDNLMTKSRALEALGKNDEAAQIATRAIAMGNVTQIHSYGRQLQIDGQQDKAFAIFETNRKKFPDHWLIHAEQARMDCAKGDYENAAKEMRLAAAGAPADQRPSIETLAKRLEAKEDINK
jgi:hypothetical protein